MTLNVEGENHPIYVAREVGKRPRIQGVVDVRERDVVEAEYREFLDEEGKKLDDLGHEQIKVQVFLGSDNPRVRQAVQGRSKKLIEEAAVQQERLNLLRSIGRMAQFNFDEEGL
ncbi:hypothetical protein KKC08_04465 [Patescibacteria group bacterium]|nr:hypothetical protein [Patescibacteria group bacterium]MCG2702401.1 hypothetical protein [Candidatus Parcubacteria bacterium]MBU4264828.1 hypothetical protein [Patescibacteria group bacterium]MBU4389699.1 hypothetical protein [Patescibacteria group bacterium]MBU4397394.1 hypothetical protein [Patescibacteria group bacterium]